MLETTRPIARFASLLLGSALAAPAPCPAAPSILRSLAPTHSASGHSASAHSARTARMVDAYTDGAAKAREDRLAGLLDFVEWARTAKSNRLRDIAYEGIVVLDPEHKDARKHLKYSFDRKKGEWVRKRKYKAPRPGKPAVELEGAEKLKALDDAFVETMIDLIDEHEEKLGVAKRYKELGFVMAAAPDQVDIRELLGYVAVEPDEKEAKKGARRTWVTKASVETAGAREEIAKSLAAAREALPALEDGELKDAERAIDVEWNDTIKTDRVRVVHNVESDEAIAVAEVGHYMWEFLPDVLGSETRIGENFTIFLVQGEKARAEVIASHPLPGKSDPESMKGVGATWYSTGPASFNWSPERVNRIDSSCKQITAAYIRRCYNVDSRKGWIVEGVSQYINRMVVGTRLTYSITKTEYEDKVNPRTDENVRDANADWIAIAGEVLAEAKPTRLARTLGRNTNELNSEDLVLAYSLVAYLREGHGVEMLGGVMESIGKGEGSSVVVLEEALGAPLPAIQRMLGEWIAEVGGHTN